jgi:phosphatidylglycerophosphate synthase
MRDVALRNHKDRLMGPVARTLFFGIHPNYISLAALLVGLACAVAVVQQAYWWGLGLWIGNRILDGLDGLVARQSGKVSDFGGYLDLLLDFIVYLAVPLAFVAAQPTSFTLWAALLLVSVYVLNTISWTVLSAILEKHKYHRNNRLTGSYTASGRTTTIAMPVGLIEGAETILLYTLFFLMPGLVGHLFLIMAGLVLFTAGQRVVWAYRNLRLPFTSARVLRGIAVHGES